MISGDCGEVVDDDGHGVGQAVDVEVEDGVADESEIRAGERSVVSCLLLR